MMPAICHFSPKVRHTDTDAADFAAVFDDTPSSPCRCLPLQRANAADYFDDYAITDA